MNIRKVVFSWCKKAGTEEAVVETIEGVKYCITRKPNSWWMGNTRIISRLRESGRLPL
jgi:hypothetical protein